MTHQYTDSLSDFRDFAKASRKLCRTLSSTGTRIDRDLVTSIVSVLRRFPDEVYSDVELIAILDGLADDGRTLDPPTIDPWVAFLLRLGFAHVERYRLFGSMVDLERSVHLSKLADSIITRETNPRRWAFTQVLIGDSSRLSFEVSGDYEYAEASLIHYHNALEIIQRDTDPYAWVHVTTGLSRAYAVHRRGEWAHNLDRAERLYGTIQEFWAEVGSARDEAAVVVTRAELRATLNRGDEDIQLALGLYRHALETFRSIGDESAVEDVIVRINALDTVSFTAFYPRNTDYGKKYGLIVYAHLPELQDDVQFDAEKFTTELGDGVPRPRRTRSNVKLERDTRITVVPECQDLHFDPPELTKKWDGSLVRFLFDFEPNRDLLGEVTVVRVSIQVAGVEIASIANCAIEVIAPHEDKPERALLSRVNAGKQTATLYQNIFVSYSRRDSEVTERYKMAQTALGNEAFIDVDDLRAGEKWKTGLAIAIDNADVFQLFWSVNSENSRFCQYEWNYALESRNPNNDSEGFIRPVYWNKPMPDPPPELSHINFKYVPFDNRSRLAVNGDVGEQ